MCRYFSSTEENTKIASNMHEMHCIYTHSLQIEFSHKSELLDRTDFCTQELYLLLKNSRVLSLMDLVYAMKFY